VTAESAWGRLALPSKKLRRPRIAAATPMTPVELSDDVGGYVVPANTFGLVASMAIQDQTPKLAH
jgi:hypothetical protein